MKYDMTDLLTLTDLMKDISRMGNVYNIILDVNVYNKEGNLLGSINYFDLSDQYLFTPSSHAKN